MPHFLISKNSIENNKIIINDKELLCHIVQSLRVKTGEVVKFIDESENVYFSEIESVSKKEITAKILKSEKSERRLNFNLCVLISVLKQEAMHLAIENAVQLGAKEIYTVYSDNASVKKDLILNKAEKWQKIGTESFKQCERADMPKVFDILKFDEIFSKFKKENILVFAEKYDEFSVKEACLNLDKNEKILAVFGPEGGFSEKEFEYFKNENIKLVTLGKLILKAPNAITAGLFGVIQNV